LSAIFLVTANHHNHRKSQRKRAR